MIAAENLSKHFEDFVAVDSVSLNVNQGEVLALLGPNGAGKTTTIRMLTSILKPTSGRAVVAGYDVVEEPKKVRASVGVLTENHGLYHRMPALEYLQFFGQLYGIEEKLLDHKIDSLVSRFGLSSASQRRIGEYSKGMRQKLALARALLHDPQVLVMDEPTAGLDPNQIREFRENIKTLGITKTILISTHILQEVEAVADRVLLVNAGKMIFDGTPGELMEDGSLEKPFYRMTGEPARKGGAK